MKTEGITKALLILGIVLMLGGCNSKEGEGSEISTQKQEEKIRIGMSFDSFVIERWQLDRDVFVSMAKELGAEVNIQNANGDINEQRNQIDYFIEKGMNVIVIIAIDANGLSEHVKKARDAGIKVIAYDRLICNAGADLYISFDNEKVGTMMAQALVDKGVAGGTVLMLGGSLGDNNVSLVESGFKKVMEKNDVKILDSFHAEGWRAELAANYVYKNHEIVEQADAIMCGNDDLASQVARALAEKRLLASTLIVGQDADLEACQRIVEGTQVMTVYKPFEKLAQRAAECAVLLAKGEEITGDDVKLINDGRYNIPYVGLEPVSVTKDNINSVIIDSGFHLKEDVYLNMPRKLKEMQ